MDTPQLDQPVPPPKKWAPSTHLIPLGIVAVILAVGLVIGLVTIVTFEQQHRAEEQRIALASPSPLASEVAVSPTPKLTYESQIPGISKQRTVEIFLAASGIIKPDGEHRLIRWQRKEIAFSLRGQPNPADTLCLTAIENELNPIMGNSKLVRTESNRAPLQIFLLPKSQFSSVYVDAPPEKESFIVYYTESNGALSLVQMLVNAERSDAERCQFVRANLLKALGLLHSSVTLEQPTYISGQLPALDTPYTEYDREMIRILYSPLLTAGLTAAETERRLLQ